MSLRVKGTKYVSVQILIHAECMLVLCFLLVFCGLPEDNLELKPTMDNDGSLKLQPLPIASKELKYIL